jgi:hypothetical protein
VWLLVCGLVAGVAGCLGGRVCYYSRLHFEPAYGAVRACYGLGRGVGGG